ncbi:type II toxin-antitoxin system VapC family toxin [Natronomonas marina]|jgi:predicted nucleic acid-binding protein|uniref:type II toxin-antitoxin system VapC family toxin n=1 Tax=Natronomonas marina TaxID=2961939 RepID=UPI0020C9B67D|nr:PIN domain-containing protein [Natronomonas marina]
MNRSVVDANVLIAARLSRDQNHETARDITREFDEGSFPTGYVFDTVLEEVLNYLQARSTHDAAVRTLDATIESNGFEIARTRKSDFDAGRSLFRRYQSLSLTDGIIAAAMDRRNLEYLYSFDDGFDAVDEVTRLDTAADPFA